MALKRILDSIEGLSQELAALYVLGADGKYHLDLEGSADDAALKSALQKEREAVAELKQQLSRYRDVDPEKYNEALRKLSEIEDKKLIEEGKLEELLQKRTETMKRDHQAQLEAAQSKLAEFEQTTTKLRESLSRTVIENGIVAAVTKVGNVRKEALSDVLSRGQTVWGLDENNNPVPRKSDGTPIYGKDGRSVMTMDEWAQTLVTEAPHLFEKTQGGSARTEGSTQRGGLPENFDNLSPADKLALGRRAMANK